MENPIISIIISTYNGSQTLPRALQSIQSQTYTNYEVIAVNDASTDHTGSLLMQWQKSIPQLHIITNPSNTGLTKSLNQGITQATGKYIARLDDDDWWEPTKLEEQVRFLSNNKACGLIGTWYLNHYPSTTRTKKLPLSDREIKEEIFKKNPFGHSCVVFKKSLWEKVSGYDENLRHSQDLDLWFRFLPHTKMANIPKVLCHRAIKETVNKPLQMKNHIKTTIKYMRFYQASPRHYLYLVEPLLLMITPRWIRNILRP